MFLEKFNRNVQGSLALVVMEPVTVNVDDSKPVNVREVPPSVRPKVDLPT